MRKQRQFADRREPAFPERREPAFPERREPTFPERREPAFPERREPTWRIPIGVLALVASLLIYGGIIARLLAPLLAHWPVLAQAPVYLVLGVIWLLPLRRFMIWMETGRVG